MLSISYNDFHLGFLVFEALNGIFTSALAGLIIYAIIKNRRNNAPITAWSINVTKSTKSLNALILASFLFVFVFLIYYLGTVDANVLQMYAFKATAEVLGSITYIIVTLVVFSWFRLFRRFI